MRRLLLALALSLAGCQTPPVPTPGFALGPTGGAIDLRIAPARSALAVAHAWHASDVYEYNVSLQRFDAASGTFKDPQTPLTSTVHQGGSVAHFGDLSAGKYQASVIARGNAGGTAPDTQLNAAHAATALFDLTDPNAALSQTLTVTLDDVPFALALQLPSDATVPGSVPAWVTGLDAALIDPAQTASTVATASYTASEPATIEDVKGDTHYTLKLTVHSPTGQTVSTIPDLFVPRADGTEQVITPSFTLVPPSGTLLASYTFAWSTFGIAIDPNNHLWVTDQHANTLMELDTSGHQLISPIAMGNQPRGIACDPATGDIWVADFYSNNVKKITNGVVVGTYATGFFPGGVAIDAQHHVWIANALSNNVTVLDAGGHPVAGSPFDVGSSPGAIAIDPATGDAWVSDNGDNTVAKIKADGTSTQLYSVGTSPEGIAVDAQHNVWVANNGNATITHLHTDGVQVGAPISVPPGPSAIAVDPATGDVWVALLGFNGIGKLKSDGTWVGSWTAGTFPAGIAIDAQHHAWVSGTAGTTGLTEIAP